MADHPGGSDLLMMAAGRDASLLVASYHRRDGVFRSALAALPRLAPPLHAAAHALIDADPHSRAAYADYHDRGIPVQSELYTALKARVNALFPPGASSRGGWFMLTKSIFLLAVTAATYYACVVRGNLGGLACVLGVLFALCGLTIQHDANHGALTRWRTVNAALAFVDDVIGGSALCWRTQHVAGHHQHPNDTALDADSYSNWPVIRFNPAMPLRWYHAAQCVYAPLLYCFIGVAYPIGDVTDVLRGAHEHTPMHPLRARDAALFVAGKLAHYGLTVALPVALWGWHTALLGFWLPFQLAGGLFLAASFAVSHNTEATEYNTRRGAATPCWAEQQIRSSANWSADSTAAWLLWGGLNLQVGVVGCVWGRVRVFCSFVFALFLPTVWRDGRRVHSIYITAPCMNPTSHRSLHSPPHLHSAASHTRTRPHTDRAPPVPRCRALPPACRQHGRAGGVREAGHPVQLVPLLRLHCVGAFGPAARAGQARGGGTTAGARGCRGGRRRGCSGAGREGWRPPSSQQQPQQQNSGETVTTQCGVICKCRSGTDTKWCELLLPATHNIMSIHTHHAMNNITCFGAAVKRFHEDR